MVCLMVVPSLRMAWPSCFLCVCQRLFDSILVHPSILSLIVPPTFILPCYWSVNLFIKAIIAIHIYTVYRRIIPQHHWTMGRERRTLEQLFLNNMSPSNPFPQGSENYMEEDKERV